MIDVTRIGGSEEFQIIYSSNFYMCDEYGYGDKSNFRYSNYSIERHTISGKFDFSENNNFIF